MGAVSIIKNNNVGDPLEKKKKTDIPHIRGVPFFLNHEAIWCERAKEEAAERASGINAPNIIFAVKRDPLVCHYGADCLTPKCRSYASNTLDGALITVVSRPRAIAVMQISRTVQRRGNLNRMLAAEFQHFIRDDCKIGCDHESKVATLCSVYSE